MWDDWGKGGIVSGWEWGLELCDGILRFMTHFGRRPLANGRRCRAVTSTDSH